MLRNFYRASKQKEIAKRKIRPQKLMDNNKAHDLLLLMVNLVQLKRKGKVLEVFFDAINHLSPDIKIKYSKKLSGKEKASIPISTTKSSFGFLKIACECPKDYMDMLFNATAMLALILEKLDQDELLAKTSEESLKNSKMMFRMTFNQSFEFMAILTPDGKVLNINDLVYKVCGNRPQDIIGKYIWEAWWWNFEDKANKDLKSIVSKAAKGTTTNDETTFYDKDGNSHNVIRTVSPVKNDHGKIIYLIINGRDLTERKQALEDLQASEKKYRELFSRMMDGFALHEMIFDKKGKPKDYKFLEVNPAFEKMTGLQAKKIVGKTLLEVLPETEAFWLKAYGKIVLTGKAQRFENYTQSLDKYFEVLAYPAEGNKFATIFQDITKRKKSEQELQKHKEHLEDLVEEKTHDLQRIVNLMAGREIRMKELKEKIKDLTK